VIRDMKKILFVCTGNQYRSPLAAAYFQKKLQEDGIAGNWQVSSAGTWAVPEQSIPKDVLKLAKKMEIHLACQASRQVTGALLGSQDAILVMETGHEEALKVEFPEISSRISLLSSVVDQINYNVPDPRQDRRPLAVVASELFDLIDRGYQKILRLVDSDFVFGG
jgi:protein-tyrosine phosphatase